MLKQACDQVSATALSSPPRIACHLRPLWLSSADAEPQVRASAESNTKNLPALHASHLTTSQILRVCRQVWPQHCRPFSTDEPGVRHSNAPEAFTLLGLHCWGLAMIPAWGRGLPGMGLSGRHAASMISTALEQRDRSGRRVLSFKVPYKPLCHQALPVVLDGNEKPLRHGLNS